MDFNGNHSKVRPVMKVGQNFSLFRVDYQVTGVSPHSDWHWEVWAMQLDSGELARFIIPTDYRTDDGTWVGNV